VKAADTAIQGHFVGHHRIDIVDKGQNSIDTLRFHEAVELRS
jgi:hypothetical protein